MRKTLMQHPRAHKLRQGLLECRDALPGCAPGKDLGFGEPFFPKTTVERCPGGPPRILGHGRVVPRSNARERGIHVKGWRSGQTGDGPGEGRARRAGFRCARVPGREQKHDKMSKPRASRNFLALKPLDHWVFRHVLPERVGFDVHTW